MGEITVSGGKNTAVAVIPAVLLCDEPCTIENLPDEEPPAAVPRRPVMPQLADDEEPAAAEPRPGRDRVLRALRGLHRRLARTGAAAR